MLNLVKNIFLAICLSLSPYTFSELEGSYIFDKAAPGVVVVLGESTMASGIIISTKGHVITNWHVVKDQIKFSLLIFGTEKVYEAELIKMDKSKDLALIKIVNPPRNIKVIEISRIIAKSGDEVHAIGHPEQEFWSYTKGYVSQHRPDYAWHYSDKETFISDCSL